MKPMISLVLAALTIIESVIAAPLSPEQINSTSPRFYNGSCTADTITIRREWRTLSTEEKAAYIEAQQCLIRLPAQSGLQATVCACVPPQSIGITWLTSTPKDLALQRPPGIPQVLHRHHLRRHNPLRRPVPTLAPHDDARLRDPDAQRVQLHGHHAVVGRAKGRRLGRLLWFRHVGRRHGLRRQRDRGRGLPDRGALCQHHRAHRAHARVHDVLPEAHLGQRVRCHHGEQHPYQPL